MTWVFHATPQQEALSKYPSVLAIAFTFTILMLIIVGIRFYLRRARFASDDWTTAFGALCAILYNAFAIAESRYGLGLQPAMRPHVDIPKYTMYNYASRPIHQSGIAAFKVALCISYIRMIKGTTRRTYRRVIYVAMFLSGAASIAFALVNLFSCSPVKKALDQTIPGKCLPFAPVNFAVSGTNIALDVFIFLLPIPIFLKMNVNQKLKFQLSFLFALGLLVTICSVVKITYVPSIGRGIDPTPFVILSSLEINVGIIVSCLPHLRPLVQGGKRLLSKDRSRRTTPSKVYEMQGISDGSNRVRITSNNKGAAGSASQESQEKILHPQIQDRDDSVMRDYEESHDLSVESGIRKTTQFEISRAGEHV